MYLLQLRDQIPEAIMLKLAQEGMRNVGRYVATTGTFADLGGKPPGNGGGQLLSPGRFTHVAIIPMVGSQRMQCSPAESRLRSGRCRRLALCSRF